MNVRLLWSCGLTFCFDLGWVQVDELVQKWSQVACAGSQKWDDETTMLAPVIIWQWKDRIFLMSESQAAPLCSKMLHHWCHIKRQRVATKQCNSFTDEQQQRRWWWLQWQQFIGSHAAETKLHQAIGWQLRSFRRIGIVGIGIFSFADLKSHWAICKNTRDKSKLNV